MKSWGISIMLIALLAGAVEYNDYFSNKTPASTGYDTKQSDDEVPIILGLWGLQSTSSLP